MVSKANIYTEKNIIASPELLEQLKEAMIELEEKMKAAIPIKRANVRVGFGVDKVQRGIAVDVVISIAKAIKTLKGW